MAHDDSKSVLLFPEAMIACICDACGAPPFYVASRLGAMCCPHCKSGPENIRTTWGEHKIMFVPFDEPEEKPKG